MISKAEIQYEQENRKEDQHEPTQFAERMARAILRLFWHMNVDSDITRALHDDISNGNFYTIFLIKEHSKPLDVASVIYQHYKEQT